MAAAENTDRFKKRVTMLNFHRQKKDMTEELGSGRIFPLIVRLCVPAVIAQLITFLYNIVDRM